MNNEQWASGKFLLGKPRGKEVRKQIPMRETFWTTRLAPSNPQASSVVWGKTPGTEPIAKATRMRVLMSSLACSRAPIATALYTAAGFG
jgi:hypothetical protein